MKILTTIAKYVFGFFVFLIAAIAVPAFFAARTLGEIEFITTE